MSQFSFQRFLQALVAGHQPKDTPPSTNRKQVPKRPVRQVLREDREAIMASKGIVLPLYDEQEIQRRAAEKERKASLELKQSKRSRVRTAAAVAGAAVAFAAVVKLT